MKKLFKGLACVMSVAAVMAFAACGSNPGSSLGTPPTVTPLSYQERKDAAFDDLKSSAELFASQFTAAVNRTNAPGTNYAVSPVSAYMALAMSAVCAAGETRSELLSALNVTYPVLKEQFAQFYRSIIAEHKTYEGTVTGRVDLSNSIWVDKSMQPKEACIQTLADKYLCYSFSEDFYNDNAKANRDIRNFVKEKTRGLIDQEYQLSKETLFALINTLYLKDMWNGSGKDLSFTDKEYDFTQSDGTVKILYYLQDGYRPGRICETETFTHFYTQTFNGYKLKFILPQEGYTVDDVFTEENLAAVNALTDYKPVDNTNRIEYYTRCLFPEFGAEYNKDVKPLLKSEFGVQKFFLPAQCDFSSLTDDEAFCAKVQHVTKLTVDKTGVEGAAVTIVANEATSAGPDDPYIKVYEDFIVNGAFGFILTDRYGMTLFSGVINQI